MNETKFYYGKAAQNKTAFMFLGLGILGILFAYYSFFMQTEVIYLWRRVASVFLILLGFGAFLYLKLKPKRADETALIVNEKGIEGKTTAPAKAAGLIEWADIENLEAGAGGMRIYLRDKEKYQQRMNTFMAKEGFKTAQKTILISTMEINATAEEIREAVRPFLMV